MQARRLDGLLVRKCESEASYARVYAYNVPSGVKRMVVAVEARRSVSEQV